MQSLCTDHSVPIPVATDLKRRGGKECQWEYRRREGSWHSHKDLFEILVPVTRFLLYPVNSRSGKFCSYIFPAVDDFFLLSILGKILPKEPLLFRGSRCPLKGPFWPDRKSSVDSDCVVWTVWAGKGEFPGGNVQRRKWGSRAHSNDWNPRGFFGLFVFPFTLYSRVRNYNLAWWFFSL